MTILCIGAHPDDCEYSIGGSAVLWRRAGHRVVFATVTDGRRGHFSREYLDNPEALVERRRAECLCAAAQIRVEYEFLGARDGEVEVTLEGTYQITRLIRQVRPDLVVLNRPNDYHRDHRYAARMILDATFMLTVPFFCPDVPHLEKMPVFAYWQDRFTEEGGPHVPHITVPIDSVVEEKTRLWATHESQFFEWLPYNRGELDQVPQDREARHDWLKQIVQEVSSATARRSSGVYCEFAEAFQISEYGSWPSEEECLELFPQGSVIRLGGS